MDTVSSSVPIVVIGNKSDLSNQRVISYEDGKKLADKWQAEFLETSAKVGDVSPHRRS